MAISTNGLQLVRLAGAAFNQQLSASDYSEILAANKTAAELNVWANAAVAAQFKGKTTTDISKAVLANVGLSAVVGLEAWVAGQLTAGGGVAKAGETLLSLLNDYSNMSTTEAVYGASVATFNTKTANSQVASQTAGTASGTYAAVSAASATEKAAAELVAAQAKLTTASDTAAAAAATAIAAATVADTALTAAQTAQTAAAAKAALTDATVLTATTKTLTDASTVAATAKTVADAAVVTATTALTATLNVATPVASDVVTANANVIIATAKAAAAATAATTAATAAGLAKTASDAATADDVAAVTAQTALNTAATAATTAAAASVTAAAASKVAAAATTVTTDDTVAATAVTAAAATGAGAAKITADAAAKVISDAAAKVISDAAAKVISDAAAKVIADAAAKEITDAAALKVITDAAKVTADALALTLVAKPFTLTTGVDVSTGGAGADTYSATHLTIGASDILAGGAGIDTLKIIDSGTAAFAVPAARVSGFETISIQNINLVPAVAVVTGVNEAATIQFKALAAGQTVTVAGVTFTAGSTGASATNVALAFTTATLANDGSTTAALITGVGTLTGTTITAVTDAASATAARAAITATMVAAGYTPTAGTAIADSTVFTSTVNTNVVDLVATGTAVTGRPQVTTLVVGTSTNAAAGITFTYNGVGLTSAVPTAGNAGANAVAVANAINAYAGSTIADATTVSGTVTITSSTPLSLANFAAANFVVTSYGLTQSLIAASAPTITIAARTAANAGSSAAATADTVTVTNFTDATSFVSDASIGAVTFSGDLTATQSVTLKGNGAMIVGGLTATFGAAATTPVFNVSGGTKGTAGTAALNTINVGSNTTNVTVNSTDETNIVGALTVVGGRADGTLTVNASTALTTGTITSDAKNLIVTGAATNTVVGGTSLVTLGTLTMGNLTNIDASGMTVGGVSLTLPTSVLTFKGGQGNDSVTSATIAATAVIDAGLGRDTLILAANISSSAVGAQYVGFDTLRVVAAATQNVALVSGITAVQVQSGANAITGLTAVQAAAVTARASIAASTFALTDSTGTADVFSMTLGQGTTDLSPASLTGALTLTGFETVNLTAVAGPAVAAGAGRVSTIASFDDISANTINLRGTAFTITTLANATGTRAKVLTVDGSALVGNGDTTNVGLTASGNIFAGSTVIGSATADNNFTLGTEIAVTYTGGAGKDSFTGSSAEIAAQTINGGAGNDTLVITDGADTIANATFAKVTNMEFLTLNEVAALSLTTGTAFNTAFTSGAATITATALATAGANTINTSAYAGKTTLVVTTGATTHATDLTTGDGDDKVTLIANATTSGLSTIVTGAGNDTITATHTAGGTLITNATLAITGGPGADLINTAAWGGGVTAVSNVIFTITAGDSTANAYDRITGFYAGAGGNPKSDTLNFTGSSIKPVDGFAATTVVGFTAATLQVAANTSGLLTFTGTSATSLTAEQVIAAYASTIDAKLNNLETVTWSGATDTYVFNNNLLGDSVVMLVGVTGITSVGAAAATVNTLGIA